jgi:hypothetical protein
MKTVYQGTDYNQLKLLWIHRICRPGKLRLAGVTLKMSLNLIREAALGPGVYSASNRNEYQKHCIIMFLASKVRRVCRADNLTAICEPTVV